MRLTDLEKAVLDNIALNSYQPTNYSRPDSFDDTAPIWSHSIMDSSSTRRVIAKSLPGVTSSLAKKGLVTTTDEGKFSTISLTRAGFDAWNAAFPKGETS